MPDYDELVPNIETSLIMIHKCIIEIKNDLAKKAPHGAARQAKICFVTLDCFQTQEVCKFV